MATVDVRSQARLLQDQIRAQIAGVDGRHASLQVRVVDMQGMIVLQAEEAKVADRLLSVVTEMLSKSGITATVVMPRRHYVWGQQSWSYDASSVYPYSVRFAVSAAIAA